MYYADDSPALITTITNTAIEWQPRSVGVDYLVVDLVWIVNNIPWDAPVINKSIYLVLGIN